MSLFSFIFPSADMWVQMEKCFAEELFTWKPVVKMLQVVHFIFYLGWTFEDREGLCKMVRVMVTV